MDRGESDVTVQELAKPSDDESVRQIPDFARPCRIAPHITFQEWIEHAVDTGQPEPTAMALATLASDGAPRLRWVLCKGWDVDGPCFYTNLQSDKGQQLARDQRVAAALHWPGLERQVRIEGNVTPLSSSEADAYYASRPRLSRLGAWASRQSQPLADRLDLLEAVEEVEARFADTDPPRPSHWSGFRIRADGWEFWQGRPGRLHDRRVCERVDGIWHEWALYP